MYRLAVAVALMTCSPAFAQSADPARDCASGQAAAGIDCTKPENKPTEVKPATAPQTNLKETVIPKAGATQTPATTPTTGVNK